MRKIAAGCIAVMTLMSGGVALPRVANAQTTPPSITLELHDVPIRAALEQICTSAHVDYSIDPTLQGYVNLKVTDLSLESAFKLIMRSSTMPMTYAKEGNVYVFKPRHIDPIAPVAPLSPDVVNENRPLKKNYELIELTYADPMDLAQLLHIILIPVGTRQGNRNGGSQGIGGNPGGNSGNNAGNGTPGRNGGSVGQPGNGGVIIGSGN